LLNINRVDQPLYLSNILFSGAECGSGAARDETPIPPPLKKLVSELLMLVSKQSLIVIEYTCLRRLVHPNSEL